MKRFAAIGVAAVLVAAGTGTAAQAAPNRVVTTYYCHFFYNGVNIRQGPGLKYRSNGQGQQGQEFAWNGNEYFSDNVYWFQGTDTVTSVSGWVDSEDLDSC